MKVISILIPIITITACVLGRKNIHAPRKLEIIRTDTIRDHYVFKTKYEANNEVFVLAEKDKVESCRPFKKFIISDSIHQVSAIRLGSRYDLIGFNVSKIDEITIKKSNELANVILNCDSFTD